MGTWEGGHGRVGIALKVAGLGWTDPNQNAGWIDTCLIDDRFLELQQEKRGVVHPPQGCPQLVGARLDAQQALGY